MIGEESLYSFRILNLAKTYSFIEEKPVYFYVNHSGSQSKTESEDPWGNAVKIAKDFLIYNGDYAKYADTINAFNIVSTIVSLDRIAKKNHGTERDRKAKIRTAKFLSDYDTSYKVDKNSLVWKAKIFMPLVLYGQYKPILWASSLRTLLEL